MTMNKLTIIGNLVKDPQIRKTREGVSVCTFTVAVNRRSKGSDLEPIFFRVSAWRETGENCARYLSKGKKVGVAGEVNINTYQGSDGKQHAELIVMASEVEFLSPLQNGDRPAVQDKAPDTSKGGFVEVTEGDLPF